MLDEQKHGMGEHRYADGTVYSGEWHRGQRQGFGKLVSLDGAEYEGTPGQTNRRGDPRGGVQDKLVGT